ncbi:ubiquitin-specific protease UBP2, partial [Ascoidea rubescens DSM 1968]
IKKLRKSLQVLATAKKSQILKNFLEEELLTIEEAYEVLTVDFSCDDKTIETSFSIRLSDEGLSSIENFNKINKALFTIAIYRTSFYLLDFYEQDNIDLNNNYYLPNDLDENQCYSILGVARIANEKSKLFKYVGSNYQKTIVLDPSHFMKLRLALRFLNNNYLKNEKVSLYLKTGKIEPDDLELETLPVGLRNVGNTCYLNSLLQYLFAIKPLREFILQFNKKFPMTFNSENVDGILEKRRVGNRFVPIKEVERSYQLVYQLKYLFNDLISAKQRDIAPTEQLVYLAFTNISQEVDFIEEKPPTVPLPQPTHQQKNRSPYSSELSVVPYEKNVNKNSDLNIEKNSRKNRKNNLFKPEEEKHTDLFQPEKEKLIHYVIKPEQLQNAIDIGSQQDITECIDNVMCQIESSLAPVKLEDGNEQYDIVKKLFFGKSKQLLEPVHKNNGKSRHSIERFLSVYINMGDHPADIYDGLDNYFGEEYLSMDDGEIKKSVTITKLPEILHLQLSRVQFDRERLCLYKLFDPLPYDDIIYLDKYMDTDDPTIRHKRTQVLEWKEELKKLKKTENYMTKEREGGLTIKESLIASVDFLLNKIDVLQNNVGEDSIAVIKKEIENFDKKVEKIQNQIIELEEKISDQFKDDKKFGYKIFAVVIHRGQANYGHYFIFIRDAKKNIFRCYNDEQITEVSVENVINFSGGATETPSFLVFIREELFDDYADPLKRVVR